jgi:hypothetical protein
MQAINNVEVSTPSPFSTWRKILTRPCLVSIFFYFEYCSTFIFI